MTACKLWVIQYSAGQHRDSEPDRFYMTRFTSLKSGTQVIALAAALQAGMLGADKAGPSAGELCNEMGNVKYVARWGAGKVTLTAKGTHLTGGFEVEFRQKQIEIFPPQFHLVHKRPSGIVTQAITPFTVSTSFAAAAKPKVVTVEDARGEQQVPVE